MDCLFRYVIFNTNRKSTRYTYFLGCKYSIVCLLFQAKYHDVKVLIKQQCNITDFILDSLVSENDTKKVRVGLADDSEGSHLIKCLNGFRLQGNILRVVPVGKASVSMINYLLLEIV